MSETSIDRRSLLAAGATFGAAAMAGVAADGAVAVPAPARTFTPQPLPFNPASIPGLSEKLLVSHHDNNYVGAVKRLGAISTQFASLDPATAPGFTINGLERRAFNLTHSLSV